MPNDRRNYYGLYKDGELIAEGFCREIGKIVNAKPQALNIYAQTGKELGGYKVKVLMVVKYYDTIRHEKKEFNTLDYLYRHLKEYGNTVINDDPSQFIEELERRLNGKIKVTEKQDIDDLFNYEVSTAEAKRHHGRRRNYFILEIKYGIPEIQK